MNKRKANPFDVTFGSEGDLESSSDPAYAQESSGIVQTSWLMKANSTMSDFVNSILSLDNTGSPLCTDLDVTTTEIRVCLSCSMYHHRIVCYNLVKDDANTMTSVFSN